MALDNLVGTKYHPDAAHEVLGALDLSLYLGGITAEDVIQCMFEGTISAPGN